VSSFTDICRLPKKPTVSHTIKACHQQCPRRHLKPHHQQGQDRRGRPRDKSRQYRARSAPKQHQRRRQMSKCNVAAASPKIIPKEPAKVEPAKGKANLRRRLLTRIWKLRIIRKATEIRRATRKHVRPRKPHSVML
jgi:hypothetical protein